jgi:hypothetical protein
MIPAKNRDRKCSTCRHYQPSPLWRKGWCRNPLLYDRNTNHLVEADSLACNRTFIDYWEPIKGDVPSMGPQARTSKPRIAPSIPVDTTDPKGMRKMVTGNTPAAGMAALSQAQLAEQEARDAPKLSLVTPDYDPGEEPGDEAQKSTKQLETIEGPDGPAVRKTAAQRIREARNLRRSAYWNSTQGRIVALLLAVVALAALGGGSLLLRDRVVAVAPAATVTPQPTRPVPTPTGFGEATPTPPPTPTSALPPAGVIGVNGWVEVKAGGGLVLRDAASRSGKRLRVLRDGTKAHVVEGPVEADGFTWWRVDNFDPNDPAATGWLAGQYLVAIPPPQ